MLRDALSEMHARAEARRECSQCLDDLIDRVVIEEERRVVEQEIKFILAHLVRRVEEDAAEHVAQKCAIAA